MLSDPLFIAAVVMALIVVIVLAIGIGGFARGGEFNRRNGNRLMRWRLITQFIALLLIVAFAWMAARG